MRIGRKKKKEANQDDLRQKIRERLEWYTFEATEKEFDAQEVQALLKLLMVMEGETDKGGFDVEESWKRFPMYYKMRNEMEEAGFAFPDTAASLTEQAVSEPAGNNRIQEKECTAWQKLPGNWTSKGGASPVHRKNKGAVGIAAVILTAMVILGGTGVYAEQQGGFFHWLEKDESGVKFITSPDVEVVSKNIYEQKEDVPEEYKEWLWISESSSHNWDFINAYETCLNNMDEIKCFYKNDLSYHLAFAVTFYDNDIMTYSQVYDGYEFLYEKILENGNVFEVFQKISDDETEYAICFYHKNVRCIIQGNVEIERLQLLFDDYLKSLEKKLKSL